MRTAARSRDLTSQDFSCCFIAWFRVRGLGFRVHGFGVKGLGFRV